MSSFYIENGGHAVTITNNPRVEEIRHHPDFCGPTNGAQREGAKLRLDMASELFYSMPLHNIRDVALESPHGKLCESSHETAYWRRFHRTVSAGREWQSPRHYGNRHESCLRCVTSSHLHIQRYSRCPC